MCDPSCALSGRKIIDYFRSQYAEISIQYVEEESRWAQVASSMPYRYIRMIKLFSF